MPVYVSELVPEWLRPTPSKAVGELPARRGGKRTDFGRHFRADSFTRGLAGPAPVSTLGYFIVNGELHVHPRTWAKMVAGLKLKISARMPAPLRYMDGV
jgi:hypothetical protein